MLTLVDHEKIVRGPSMPRSDRRPWIANVSREVAAMLVGKPGRVCVSIDEPGTSEAPLPLRGYDDVLRLWFQDFDPARCREEKAYMTREQAAEVAAFLARHRGADVVVHCGAGISRSGAVVEAALAAFPEYEDRGGMRRANGHVLRLCKKALGVVPDGAAQWEE